MNTKGSFEKNERFLMPDGSLVISSSTKEHQVIQIELLGSHDTKIQIPIGGFVGSAGPFHPCNGCALSAADLAFWGHL